MNLELKNAASKKIAIAFGVLLVLSLGNVANLVLRAKHIKELTEKVKLQALIIAEKDKQLEADKVQYTSLAARLHKEIKRVGELEEKSKR